MADKCWLDYVAEETGRTLDELAIEMERMELLLEQQRIRIEWDKERLAKRQPYDADQLAEMALMDKKGGHK